MILFKLEGYTTVLLQLLNDSIVSGSDNRTISI